MTDEKRIGQQTPTKYFILPFEKTEGEEVAKLYEESGMQCYDFQRFMHNVINAVDDQGIYIHQEVGYSIPRRTGKTEILLPRMEKDMRLNKKSLYTAQLVDTSSATSVRLKDYLVAKGFEELQRKKKDEHYEKNFIYIKQRGSERITLIIDDVELGFVDFRTRSNMGGLGKGYDTLYIDEAQEYTLEQMTALQYVVTDSSNPQTIFMGTPPTRVSKGTVFYDMRNETLAGKREYTAWMEWSVPYRVDVHDVNWWYETNPALGHHITERKVRVELKDEEDFLIQRLGYWSTYNLASEITKLDWEPIAIQEKPKLKGKLFIGIKFGKSEQFVSVGVACKTEDDKIYIEVLECRDKKDGIDWIVRLCKSLDIGGIVIDGEDYKTALIDKLKANDIENAKGITVAEFIQANSSWEASIFAEDSLVHGNQPSLNQVVTNSQKRAIGTNGGFGYQCTKQGASITLLDSVIMARWLCANSDEDDYYDEFDISF